MTGCQPPGIVIPLMPDLAPLHVTLEISQSEPLGGRVHAGSGPGRPFAGWTELAVELSGCLADWQARQDAATPDAPAAGTGAP